MAEVLHSEPPEGRTVSGRWTGDPFLRKLKKAYRAVCRRDFVLCARRH